uniref:Uncharacterized protein n=1 Tax=mine drainage metagenome TaxID=410659 RepID=E6PXI2_9ZZZZ
MTGAKKTRKPGRPKLPKGNAKARYLRVRLTASELRAIETAARASGQTVSEWVRGKINATS